MIDPEWLRAVRFETRHGRVVDLLGIGSENVAFRLERAGAEPLALRVTKKTLGLHINEIPPSLSVEPEYDLNRVNEKLLKLVGNPRFDIMTFCYDELYAKTIEIISEVGIPGFIFSSMTADSVETIPFLLHTPPVERRLTEFVEWPVDPNDPLTRIPHVNGENYGIRLIISEGHPPMWLHEGKASPPPDPQLALGRRGPAEALQGLPIIPERNKELDAASLFENPLIIWGAAAMEGFFTEEEMPLVASYLETEYGSLSKHRHAAKIIGQVGAVANLLAQYLTECPVDRFVSLCAHCNVLIQARNKEGRIVADGLQMQARTR